MKRYRFTYEPFFATLKEKGLTQNRFKEMFQISDAEMDRLRNDKSMTLATIAELMIRLGVDDLEKIVRFQTIED